MPLTRRERLRAATIDEIKEVARQQMGQKGAAALSLRAIARQMGMTSPALYRYFGSRDDLVTALIVDAYNSLADALEAARDGCESDDHKQRLLEIGQAYRNWAISHPEDYTLIFGTPIPGYEAPIELTTPPAMRAMNVFISLLEAADQEGKLNPAPAYATPPKALQAKLQAWATEYGYEASIPVLYLALAGWARLHGLVWLEIFQHFDPIMGGELCCAELMALIEQTGVA